MTISGGTVGSTVEVDCTLALGPGVSGVPSVTNTWVVTLGSGIGENPSVQAAGTIPLTLPITSVKFIGGYSSALGVSCTDTATTGSPTVQMSGTINAIQTQSNS